MVTGAPADRATGAQLEVTPTPLAVVHAAGGGEEHER